MTGLSLFLEDDSEDPHERVARELVATHTRRRLLAEVALGNIARYGDGQSYAWSRGFRVSTAMADMQAAGWVELGEPGPVKTPWRLTEQGRRVRDGG